MTSSDKPTADERPLLPNLERQRDMATIAGLRVRSITI